MSISCIHLLIKFALWHCCLCLSSQADLNLLGLNRPDQLMLWDLLTLIPTTIIYRDSNLQDLHVTAITKPDGMTNEADLALRHLHRHNSLKSNSKDCQTYLPDAG